MRFRDILVLAPADYEVVTTQLLALERLGARTESIRFEPLLRDEGLGPAMRRIEAAARGKQAVFANLLGDSFHFPIEFFLRLRSTAPLVLWFYDDEMYFDAHSKHYAQAAHAVVTTDAFSAPGYERLGVPAEVCFSLVSRERRFPAPVARDIDVSFVGDCEKSGRRELLAALGKAGIDVQTWGRGSTNGRCSDADLSKIVSRSRINLNFSRVDARNWINRDEPLLDRVRGNKGRPIEIAMAGGFCLTEWYPALPKIFEPGAEIDYFCDADSLVEKVKEHLEHPERREKMAENAHRRALKEYEASAALRALLARLEERLEGEACPAPATAVASPGYARRRVNVLTVSLLSALARLELGQVPGWLAAILSHGPRAALSGVLGGLRRAAGLAGRR